MKPKMPETPITEIVHVLVTPQLAADRDRYSSSTILLSMSKAAFKAPDGSEGVIYVGVGGNVVDVTLGERTWRINLAALAEAAWIADQAYLKKVL